MKRYLPMYLFPMLKEIRIMSDQNNCNINDKEHSRRL